MTITEKVAYLKGMADGMELGREKSKESKLLTTIIDVLEDISFSIEDLEEAAELLNEGLDTVSEDLEDVEDLLFGDDDCGCGCGGDCDCDDDCDCGCGCSCGEDDDFFEMECPSCSMDLVIDDEVLESGQVVCPNCGDVFALDLIDEDDEDDSIELEKTED